VTECVRPAFYGHVKLKSVLQQYH